MTFFEQPKEEMSSREYQVIQAWPNGTALAMDFTDPLTVVLLWNKKHEQYYDGQTVKAGKNQVFKHIGICRYNPADENINLKTRQTIHHIFSTCKQKFFFYIYRHAKNITCGCYRMLQKNTENQTLLARFSRSRSAITKAVMASTTTAALGPMTGSCLPRMERVTSDPF